MTAISIPAICPEYNRDGLETFLEQWASVTLAVCDGREDLESLKDEIDAEFWEYAHWCHNLYGLRLGKKYIGISYNGEIMYAQKGWGTIEGWASQFEDSLDEEVM